MGNGDQKRRLNREARRALKREEDRKEKKASENLAQAKLIAVLVSQEQTKNNEGDTRALGEPRSTPPKFKLVIGGTAGSFAIWILTLCLSAPFNYYGSRPGILYIPTAAVLGFLFFCTHKAVKLLNKSKWTYGINAAGLAILMLTFKIVGSESEKLASELNQRSQEHNVIMTNIPGRLSGIEAGISNMPRILSRFQAVTNATEIKWQPPELPENCIDATIIWGGNEMATYISVITNNKSHLVLIGETEPFALRVENNRFYVDCNLFTQEYGLIKIRGHSISPQLPWKWDMNANSNALEVVDENSSPVFQLFYRRPDQVVINGILQVGHEVWFLYSGGWETFGTNNEEFKTAARNNFKELKARIPPLFKYPAWNHPGILAD